MPDMDRAAMIWLVYQRLARPEFRERLSATAPDGTRPIIVAMRDDPIRTLIDQVKTVGGASNVVFPALNGIMVVAMEAELGSVSIDTRGGITPELLRDDSTVGVIFERLVLDMASGGPEVNYTFVLKGPNERTEHGEAKVVALAG